MNYKEFSSERIQEIQKIYASEGWSAYLNDEEKLKMAFLQSLYLYGAFDDNQLVGFIRCVGDGEHILLVQDLIVLPKYRQKGIGAQLFRFVWERFKDVRMFHVVTTTTEDVPNYFYQHFGMKKLEEGQMVSYFR